jgi:cytochrome c-L
MKSKMTVGKKTLFVSLLAGAGIMPLEAGAECKFESVRGGNQPFEVKPTENDTPEAKHFLKTCINPYTKLYVANPEKAKAGKKKFGFWSCTQCHGGNGGGQTGPSILDDTWQYARIVNDKGMFEIIAGGSDAGMPAWHQQVGGNPELMPTDDILQIIGWLRSSYRGNDPQKPWLD